jgi:proline dehydrogenase
MTAVSVMRSILLAGSQSRWLRERAPRYWFVRRTVSRFMPGDSVDDALAAVRGLGEARIRALLTHLGENITDQAEAENVTRHYLGLLDRIRPLGFSTEISVKLTQLGLDLDKELAYENLRRLVERAGERSMVWIDMEASGYVDLTLELYCRARRIYPNVGVCLQAYLYRTANDLAALLPLGPAIRLVKGAYKEPPDRAFPRKADVDQNFFELAKRLIGDEGRRAGARVAIATHDRKLIRRIEELVSSMGGTSGSLEFQMLYGIQRAEQVRLIGEGWRVAVLISYGEFWFPWFMRRLAERPANVLFLLRNVFGG